MKKVFPLVCFMFLFCCCKKSAHPAAAQPTSFITADVNGTAMSFNSSASGTWGNPDGAWNLDISGSVNSTVNAANITIFLDSNHTQFTPGVYTIAGKKGLMFYDASNGDYLNDSTSTTNLPHVIITSVTSTSIQGIFSATLIGVAGSTPGTVAITNGKFNVSFQP